MPSKTCYEARKTNELVSTKRVRECFVSTEGASEENLVGYRTLTRKHAVKPVKQIQRQTNVLTITVFERVPTRRIRKALASAEGASKDKASFLSRWVPKISLKCPRIACCEARKTNTAPNERTHEHLQFACACPHQEGYKVPREPRRRERRKLVGFDCWVFKVCPPKTSSNNHSTKRTDSTAPFFDIHH